VLSRRMAEVALVISYSISVVLLIIRASTPCEWMELEFSVSVEALPKRLRQWAAMLVNIESKRPAINRLCAELDNKVDIC
jgi:hypothetical protein